MKSTTFGVGVIADKLVKALDELDGYEYYSYKRKVGRIITNFNREINSLYNVEYKEREIFVRKTYIEYKDKVNKWSNSYIRYLTITLLKIRVDNELFKININKQYNKLYWNKKTHDFERGLIGGLIDKFMSLFY